jgi:hypothetical protein
MPSIASLVTVLAVSAVALAKTDLSGCTSSQTVVDGGASLIYYVPGTGEICAFLDCGGGRAPPKTTVPGCPAYSGTSTYSPSYLSNWGSATATATASPASSVWASSSWATTILSTAKSAYTTETTVATTAAPIVTSSASLSYQSYGTAATPLTYANGTLAATATPSATPSSALSNDGVAQSGSQLLVLAGAAIAGFAMW